MKDINIVFENLDFIVIDKPYGIVVNRSETTSDLTIQDWVDRNILEINGCSTEDEFCQRSVLFIESIRIHLGYF